jgi:hypothetical protein
MVFGGQVRLHYTVIFLHMNREKVVIRVETNSEYYGLYALKNLLDWPSLHLVLLRRKRITSRRTVVLSGAAQTGKTIALQLLLPRLPEFKVLLVSLPQQTAPGRKITWRPFLLSILAAQGQQSTTRDIQALQKEVGKSLSQYDLLIIDQAERFSLQYLSNLCAFLRTSRCAVLISGQRKFWEKVRNFDPDQSFAKLVEDVMELDENDVWYCWGHGI